MKKVLWMIPVILLIMVSFAAYLSSSEAGYPARGENVMASRGQQDYGNPQGYDQNLDTTYFYDQLSPYGDWIELNPFGYVWVPRHMGYRWRPYSEGHWIWSDYGWTWIADEEWGDIPFHYGRWGWDDEIGWFWVPGTLWGPAWVTWRSNDQYMGWAPFPPSFEFRAGMNFNSLSINIPLNFWVFILGPHFQDRDLNPYLLPFERNQTIINFTSMHNNMYTRNNRVFNEGFGVDAVRQITGRAVPIYALQNARQPGRTRIVGQQVQIFQPTIRQNNAAKPKAFLNTNQARQTLAPAKIFDPRTQQPIAAEAAAVQKRQVQERTLLATTQAQEIKNMQQQRDAEARRVTDAAAKAKVNQTYDAKITDLKKNHVVETQQLTVRHNNDAAQVKRVTQAPPVKKKKID
jgi:hypothetical protein